ncbi:MAG: ATP synthase F1 subunit gamma [Myxococcales bacterium]|nr:ATP synthase F1 subunit gamma [Myxococcales bacterium]MCB9752475.1 ATP synthase F1 subunit gamma [Myxococcales bacterium]
MGSLKEIRNRITTVKSTRKITSAMSRIASAQLVKAQNAATSARPYGDRLEEVVRDLLNAIDADAALSPLLASKSEIKTVGLVVLTADRGLCGGFNANVNRATKKFVRDQEALGVKVEIVACGKKSHSYLRHEDIAVASKHPSPDLKTIVDVAKSVCTEVAAMFTESKDTGLPHVDSFFMIYNHFKNVLVQEVTTLPLLPFQPAEGEVSSLPPVFEPDPASLLDHLLPVALQSRVQQAMFNSVASEIASRRMAMDSATDNASELIGDLTLEYNRERQAAITKELMEIIGGAEALK